MFNIKWYFTGSFAFLFAIIGLIYAFKSKQKGSQIMSFCSLSFGFLTVLEELKMIWTWYNYGEMVAFKTTPEIISTLNIFWWVLFCINLISLYISVKKK